MWYNASILSFNEHVTSDLQEYRLLHVLLALTISQLITRVAGGPATSQFPPVSIKYKYDACCDNTSQHATKECVTLTS